MRLFTSLGVSSAITVLSYLGLGAFYQVNDDHALMLLFEHSGSLTKLDFGPYFRLLGPMLSMLYEWKPGFPWYGVLLYALITWALSVFLRIYSRLLASRDSTWSAVLSGLMIFSMFLLEHWVVFTFSRVSFLLAFAGASLWQYRSEFTKTALSAAESGFLLLTALLLRYEFALLAIALTLAFHWPHALLALRKSEIRSALLKQMLPAFLLAGSLLLAFSLLPGSLNRDSADRFILPVLVQDYGYERSGWMKTEKDTLLRKNLLRYNTADNSVFTAEKLRTISYASAGERLQMRSPRRDIEPWKEAAEKIWRDLKIAHHPALSWCILFAGLLLFNTLIRKQESSGLFIWIGFLAAVFLSCMSLDVYQKLNDRILGPVCTLLVLSSVFHALKNAWSVHRLLVAALLVLAISGPKKWQYLEQQRKVATTFREYAWQYWSEISLASEGRLLVSTIPVYYYLLSDGDPFREYPIPHRIIQLDGWTARLDGFQLQLAQESGLEGANYAVQLAAVFNSEAALVGDRESIVMLRDYVRMYYHMDLVASEIPYKSQETPIPIQLFSIKMSPL